MTSQAKLFACSHVISGPAGHSERAMPQPSDQASTVRNAFVQMGRELAERRPDALVVIGTDHGRAYGWEHVSQVLVGVSAVAEGMGDAGVPEVTVPINQSVAQSLLSSLVRNEVDAAYSEAMKIDHSFVMPMFWALPDFDIPIVPIFINCSAPPIMTFKRARQIGAILREAIEGLHGLDVAVLGTGGLSHWVGDDDWRAFLASPAGTRLPRKNENSLHIQETGPINEPFDRSFLDALAEGTLDTFLTEWTEETVPREAGNGANEIRNWLIAAEIAGSRRAETICYEPGQ